MGNAKLNQRELQDGGHRRIPRLPRVHCYTLRRVTTQYSGSRTKAVSCRSRNAGCGRCRQDCGHRVGLKQSSRSAPKAFFFPKTHSPSWGAKKEGRVRSQLDSHSATARSACVKRDGAAISPTAHPAINRLGAAVGAASPRAARVVCRTCWPGCAARETTAQGKSGGSPSSSHC